MPFIAIQYKEHYFLKKPKRKKNNKERINANYD